MTPYPLRLIEVDLPIARISAHARREKSIRHGHISTLHIWWARRPLAACRAVILASLWPDPVDLAAWATEGEAVRAPRQRPGERALKPSEGVTIRPRRFLDEARARMARWANNAQGKMSDESARRFTPIAHDPALLDDPATLRAALLDFIADFADWDHSTDRDYLDTARALTQAAHEALGGAPHERPLVIDPFAGGGSIPLEALRVGADAFASDLNPIPVLLNKVVLEYIPRYGQRLADEVRKWGGWIKEQAEKELAAFYPKDPARPKDNIPEATPIAYLWARTILSEAPGEGTIPVEVPLMRSLWLAKKAGRRRALRWVRDDSPDGRGKVKTQTVEVVYQIDGQPTPMKVKRPLLEIFEPAKESDVEGGTVARGSATCPVSGFTTKVDRVRAQLKRRRGGAADARLFAVVTTREGEQGRFYRLPIRADQDAFEAAAAELRRRMTDPERSRVGDLSAIPDEPTPLGGGRGAGRAFSQRNYGMDLFADLFTPRQLLALTTLAQLVREAGERLRRGEMPQSGGVAHGGARSAEPSAVAVKGSTALAEPSTVLVDGSPTTVQPFAKAAKGSSKREEPSSKAAKGSAALAQGSSKAATAPIAATERRGTPVPPPTERSSGTLSGPSPDRAGDPVNAAPAMDPGLAEAVQTCLALCVDKVADLANAFCPWEPVAECPRNLFARQAIPMGWNFGEGVVTSESSGSFAVMIERFEHVMDEIGSDWALGHVQGVSATSHPLPDDAASAFITDPPYYDAVPYSDLSDFFYVWLKRMLPARLQPAFAKNLTPKDDECIVDDAKGKDHAYFELMMTRAMAEGRRVVHPRGVGMVVFAHKSTAGWEAQLKGMTDAGWIVTGSWPIDTEMESRFRARDSAALASSVHLICRPREDTAGRLINGTHQAGEWREVLAELPRRMAQWMPRLAAEGVVGADAIFACLGPALEIFSRHPRVEKASGEKVELREYLEHVWAAVSSEALSMIFKDADAAGLEPDARLTAMWLWTIGGGKAAAAEGAGEGEESEEGEGDEDEDQPKGKKPKVKGFVLEFDAARKIAQGLGVHLEKNESIVEVKGETARLLPVAERAKHLFDIAPAAAAAVDVKRRRKKDTQGQLAGEYEAQNPELARAAAEERAQAEAATELEGVRARGTALDRVHQAMLLFSAGRGEALRRFLVDDGIGKDGRFWTLADHLSKLYPAGTDEKRWVDGVLARKKGLGF